MKYKKLIIDRNPEYFIRTCIESETFENSAKLVSEPVEISEEIYELLRNAEEGFVKGRRDRWSYIDSYSSLQILRVKRLF
jgi:hypothetical protein